MSTPSSNNGFGNDFEHGAFEAALTAQVEAELRMAEAAHPEEVAQQPASQWLFDPVEAEQEEIELRGLLGAVKGLGALPDNPNERKAP